MLIGELAKSLGVTTKTLRHYEEIGLVPAPARADNTYRVYAPEALARARLVVGLRSIGRPAAATCAPACWACSTSNCKR